MPDSKPHSELLATKDWNVTKVVVFFRNGDDRQRYVDFEPGALTDLFEQVQSQQEWIDRVAEFSTDAATAADKAEREVERLKEQLESLREALDDIATGEWGAQAQRVDYDVRQFARDALSNPAMRQEGANAK